MDKIFRQLTSAPLKDTGPVRLWGEVLWKRIYFALFDDGLTLKTLKLAYIGFCIQTLHVFHWDSSVQPFWKYRKSTSIRHFEQCNQ